MDTWVCTHVSLYVYTNYACLPLREKIGFWRAADASEDGCRHTTPSANINRIGVKRLVPYTTFICLPRIPVPVSSFDVKCLISSLWARICNLFSLSKPYGPWEVYTVFRGIYFGVSYWCCVFDVVVWFLHQRIYAIKSKYIKVWKTEYEFSRKCVYLKSPYIEWFWIPLQ